MTTLYSFDIFDTLITRKTATPAGIFALIQHKLQTDEFADFSADFKENFYQYRTDSEFRQRHYTKRFFNNQDITFDIIYDDLKSNFCLTNEQCERLKQLEIQTELENIIPISENIQKVKELIQAGKRVVFISDMYLPEKIIRQMLVKCDVNLSEVKIYLSSTEGAMKNSRELFKKVKEAENVEYKNWEHLGDNYISDYINPNSLGIKAKLYTKPQLKIYEKNLLKNASKDCFIQLAIGCAKNIRVNNNCSDKYYLGASLAGPIFYPYVSWLLNQAQKRNIGCLYFVARDGYVLKAIADILIKERNLDIKTVYIYGSKKAWRVPSLDLNNQLLKEQFVETLMWVHKKLDKYLGLTYKEVCECIPKEFHSFKKGFSSAKSERLKQFILSDGRLLKLTVERNAERRKNAVAYLKQMIELAQDRKFAFVDVDGTRFSMNCMSGLIHEFYDVELTGFYFASTPTVFEPVGIQYNHFYSFKEIMLGHVLELLVRAPHGQTLGYKLTNKGYEPELEDLPKKNFEDWGFEDYMDGVLEFIIQFNKWHNEYKDKLCFENLNLFENYVEFLTSNVDKDTANLLGCITHNLYGKESGEFASAITFGQAVKYIFTNSLETENILYSKARSPRLIRKLIEYKEAHPDLRKEIFNIFIHKRRRQAYMQILGFRISFRHLLWKDVV